MKNKIAILISGRGSNMKAIVENVQNGILKGLCEVIVVFSNKINAPGLEISESFGLDTKVIESKGKKRSTYDALLYEYLDSLDPDYIILAGYMKIISSNVVQRFRNRIINIHPADTALHQGLHGYEWAFENKMESTKITVHFIDEGLDTGQVIAKREVDLKGATTLEEVEKRGLAVEHVFYSECLKKILTAKSGKAQRKGYNE
ncbi:MAG: phosphoribosylglycinamide formyltransferase [Candidatus Cloacimonetes bacterium]|nr:phosphoribosylglycinamide formyltransferase [Candidatus Cloacimonadota bacterium]